MSDGSHIKQTREKLEAALEEIRAIKREDWREVGQTKPQAMRMKLDRIEQVAKDAITDNDTETQ